MNCILFLNGKYPSKHLDFYRLCSKDRFKIAVDGGYEFFRKTKITPDLLIGDFDSLKKLPSKLSDTTEVLKFPTDKDMTDTELALDYCKNKNAELIEIVMPGYGEVDHFLGSVMLLANIFKTNSKEIVRKRIINFDYEIDYLKDERIILEKCKDSQISVIPVTSKIELSCDGMRYNVSKQVIKLGSCHGLRNLIVKSKAEIEIKGGALLIRNIDRAS